MYARWLGIPVLALTTFACSSASDEAGGVAGMAPSRNSGTAGGAGVASEGGQPSSTLSGASGTSGEATGGAATGGASDSGGASGEATGGAGTGGASDAGIGENGGSSGDAAILDGGVADVAVGDGAAQDACGEVGLSCAEGGCGSGFRCDLGVCVPSERGGCGGAAGWTCDDAPYTECLYHSGSDYGSCLTVVELACACEVARSSFACPN